MKQAVVLLVLMVFGPFYGLAHGDFIFTAVLDEAQAGGTGSAATGTATLVLNDDMTELTMNIQFDGIATADITAFHIHQGDFGVPGPVVFGLVSPNHDTDGDFMDLGNGYFSAWDGDEGNATLASQLDNLFNEGLYFNMHTADFPAGEIRGQILPIPEPSTTGLLAAGLVGLICRRRT